MGDKSPFQVEPSMIVGELIKFDVKHLCYTCKPKNEEAAEAAVILQDVSAAATSKAINAFEVLMKGARVFPKKKTNSSGMKDGILNRKDAMYNDLVDMCIEQELDFPKSSVDDSAQYFVQVLCNALWYVTNHMITIDETACRQKDVTPIPDRFAKFSGYNDTKRKKIKSNPMSSIALKGHADTLYSLLDKPYVNSSTGSWAYIRKSLSALAASLFSYSEYLNKQTVTSSVNKALPHPPRMIDQHASVIHCTKTAFIQDRYRILNNVVLSEDKPIVFNENVHVACPFENNTQRQRYFENLHLSVPVDILKFCPGGSIVTTHCITKVAETRTTAEMVTNGAQLMQKMRPELKVCNTRAQKALFKRKISYIAKVQPSLLDFIYADLAMDSSAMNHPDIQQRLRMITLGEEGLMADMRHLNPGRPNDKFDTFFYKLCELCSDHSAEDDRRHGPGVAHMSKYISLSDMISEAAKACPEGTPIPSKSLVRLQFIPTNPYTKIAQTYTSKVPIQYKIQRRQLRAAHPDDHYCAALFKYLRHKAVELKEDAVLICADDKAKVPVGEPNKPVSTGVRGRVSIAGASEELSALDHDMNMSSLTPSVVLECQIPNTPQESFVRGKVGVFLNDSVTQPSSPFRHAVQLKHILERGHEDQLPSILLKYTDGGTDQRNTLEAVKCANICLFLEMRLDMLIAARCAPGQSYCNPAERIMAILNYGLQNVATERAEQDEETEKLFRKCGSMSGLREMMKKQPNLIEKWIESVEPVQALLQNRFRRLKLKDEPFVVIDPVRQDEIDLIQRHLRELFPDLDTSKLQKLHTNKCKAYIDWKARHCRETQYTLQIRKCDDESCCLPKTINETELQWLPDPMLEAENPNKFQTYENIKGKETDESDRPSLKVPKNKKSKADIPVALENAAPTEPTAAPNDDAPMATADTQNDDAPGATVGLNDDSAEPSVSPNVVPTEPKSKKNQTTVAMSAQNARSVTICVECRKPRVVYSNIKLSQRKQVMLATTLSEYEFSCGTCLFPPSTTEDLKQSIIVRPGLQCCIPIEIPYYGADIGRKDLCAYCGVPEAITDMELKKMYRTVLPLCDDCRRMGKAPVVQRKYGKKKY